MTVDTEKMKALALAAPCPWCGQSPDVTNEAAFRLTDGEKYGALQCCGIGPEVRTDYKPVEHWKARAIEAWNERTAPAAGTEKDAEPGESSINEIRTAIADYYRALNARQHGELAMDRAFRAIERELGMSWDMWTRAEEEAIAAHTEAGKEPA